LVRALQFNRLLTNILQKTSGVIFLKADVLAKSFEPKPMPLYRVRTMLRMQRGKSGRFASLGLLTVLIVLPGFALWGAVATYRSGVAVTRAIELSNSYEQARFAVGEEESLERKYRLDPDNEVRTRHREAGTVVAEALRRAATADTPANSAVIDEVLAQHKQYLLAINHMFAAVDANDVAAAKAIDESEIDPRFDNMQSLVVAAATLHRTEAAGQLAAQRAIQTWLLIATPVVFSFGVLLAIFFWRLLRTYERDAQAGRARETSGIRTSERRFRGLVQNASDMILICTASGTITYQSPAAEVKWDYRDADLLDEPFETLTHSEDQPAWRDLWEQMHGAAEGAPGGISGAIEIRLHDGGGQWRHAEVLVTNLLNDPAMQGMVVTVRDVTERKAFEQQLTQQAFYDALTGLPNRVLFRDRLEQALVRAVRRKDAVGLLFLDLDNFKLINDSLGHQVGDKLLVEAAARLRACVRDQDTVARLGGDEFVVVLELLAGEEDALPAAKAIAHQFSRPFMLDDREVVVTVSIGIAISTAGQEHADNLLRNADVAMYRAKSDGRARYVVFDPSMHTDSLALLELENDLRRALQHDELRVYYQPIITMETGKITEVEALVRWQHPTRGLVFPNEFIAIAETTGLIIPLGLWVLEEACRQAAAWHGQFPTQPPLILSVNLSPRQFQQPTIVADVARALKESGFPANCLKLEITEGIIMEDVEATIRTLWELKGLGLQIAVDDFGTGYSSLSYLKRLPLDVLKIDRSFVSGIGHNQEDTAIVHAIMAMAKSLNFKVTGEGIETAEQLALLGQWGCDSGQGYLFSKPLDSHDAEALLETATRSRSDIATAETPDHAIERDAIAFTIV
jgi:diguanylate cyclase (GGDEF)-like protein/PAS domain S-box-containing protein